MARQTINKNHPAVSTSANTANVLTEIFRVKTPERIEYDLLDQTPLVMKLISATDVEAANTSDIVVAVLAPGKLLPTEVDRFIYDPWKQLSLAEQSDVQKQTRLRLSLRGGGIALPEQYVLIVMVKADVVVDWTKSNLVFEVVEKRIGY